MAQLKLPGRILFLSSDPETIEAQLKGKDIALADAGVLRDNVSTDEITPAWARSAKYDDLVGGQIQMGFSGIAPVLGQIKGGRLRAIGVSTPARSAVIPDVPTLAESGLPNYNIDGWIALIGPSGLPKAVVDRLYAEAKAALSLKEVRDTFAVQGRAIIGNTPDAAAQYFQTEVDKYAKLVKRSGAAVD